MPLRCKAVAFSTKLKKHYVRYVKPLTFTQKFNLPAKNLLLSKNLNDANRKQYLLEHISPR